MSENKCLICGTTESSYWRRGGKLCNKCYNKAYLKGYRVGNRQGFGRQMTKSDAYRRAFLAIQNNTG